MVSALLGLYVFYVKEDVNPALCWNEIDLSSINFFTRNTVREHMIFHTRLIVQRGVVGQRQSVTLEGDVGVCHLFIHNSGLAAACITSTDYVGRVAHELLVQVLRGFVEQFSDSYIEKTAQNGDCTDQFAWAEGVSLFNEYKDPLKLDKLSQVNQELEQVRDIMLQNIEDLLNRGEKMEELMARTSDLNAASVEFYKRARANNQCCAYGA